MNALTGIAEVWITGSIVLLLICLAFRFHTDHSISAILIVSALWPFLVVAQFIKRLVAA